MAVKAYRQTNVGQTQVIPADLGRINVIQGTAVSKGDVIDATGSTATSLLGLHCGWAANNRAIGVARLPLADPSRVPRSIKVVDGWLQLYAIGHTFALTGGGYALPTGAKLRLYPILRNLSSTLAGLTWANWFTASAWQELGAQLTPGLDTSGLYGEITLAGSNLMTVFPTGGVNEALPTALPLIYCPDIIEMSYRLGHALQWLVVANWAHTGYNNGTGTASVHLDLPDHATQRTRAHSCYGMKWWYSKEFFLSQVTGTRRPDRARMLDHQTLVPTDHILQGRSVSRGATSPVVDGKVWLCSMADSGQSDVCVISNQQHHVGSIVVSGAASGARVRGIKGYDVGSGNNNASGTAWITFTSGTLYTVTFLEEGATGAAETLGTGLDWTADQVIQRSSDDFLFIPGSGVTDSVAWDGTPATGDVFSFDIRKDATSSTYTATGLNRVHLVPATGSDRNTPDTAHARPAAGSTAQQLYTDSLVVANSGGSTDSCCTVSDGGDDYTHAKLHDTSQILTDRWATLCNQAVPQRRQEVWVVASFEVDHATYPMQVRLSASASAAVPIADPEEFTGDSYLTTGIPLSGINGSFLPIGELAASTQTILASPALTSSKTLTLSQALPLSPGSSFSVYDINPDSSTYGQSQAFTVDTAAGVTVTVTTFPTSPWPARSLVLADDDTTQAPLYIFAAPETGDTLGQVLGLLDAEEMATV